MPHDSRGGDRRRAPLLQDMQKRVDESTLNKMTSGRGLLNFTVCSVRESQGGVVESNGGVGREGEGAVNFPFSKINTSTLVRRPAGSLYLDLTLLSRDAAVSQD